MRDKSNRKSNFSQVVSDSSESYSGLLEAIKGGKYPKERETVLINACLDTIKITSEAQFSNGDSKESIMNVLQNFNKLFSAKFKWKWGEALFEHLSFAISMAILLNIDIEEFKQLSEIIKRDKAKDKLLDYLIKFKEADWSESSNQFIQKTPYGSLSKIIDETDESTGIKLIKNYLNPNVWYAGHSDAGWHNSHLEKHVNIYSGYWSWEVAAIVKAKGWNDDELKEVDYYPYDTVHW